MHAPTCIGVLSPVLEGTYNGRILQGIHAYARRHGAQVIAQQTLDAGASDEEIAPQIETLFARDTVAGWISVAFAAPPELLSRIQQAGCPLVTISKKLPTLTCPMVMPDNRDPVAAVVRHLVAHGHRRIAFVGNCRNNDIQERFEGYQIGLAEHGIAYDPQLYFSTNDPIETGGWASGQHLLAAGLPCTAVIVGTDRNAIGLMGALQSAGCRIPEDLAIVGFDDIPMAQDTKPPLTTVRQHIEAVGARATELLLRQIAGEPVPSGPVYVASELILRYSCGCASSPTSVVMPQPAPDWFETLVQRLGALLRPARQAATSELPAPTRPAAELLAQMLRDLIETGAQPQIGAIQQVWNAVLAHAPTPEALGQALALIRRVAGEQMAQRAAAPSLRDDIGTFLDQLGTELVRASMASVLPQTNYFEQIVRTNYDISIQMLNAEADSTYDLSWLRGTDVRLGYLAVWDQPQANRPRMLRVVGGYPPGALAAELGQLYAPEQFPPTTCQATTQPIADDHIISLLPLRTHNQDWGVLGLIGPIDTQMRTQQAKMNQWAALLSGALQRAELLRSLAERTSALSAANAELARAARLKDEFLAGMSHELRTPLNAILGISESLQEHVYGPLTEQQCKKLALIEESGRHLLALINDVLDLAKIGADKLELTLETVDVDDLCQASLRLIKEAAQKKRLTLSATLDGGVTKIVGDERRLKQILVNLLNNAVKFTPEGGQVGLEVQGDAPLGLLRMIVRDTGIGIAPEDQARLFQPFVQLDSSLARQHSGTGLGLALVARLTALHGGSVTVQSAPGQGSRFTVTLPWPATERALMDAPLDPAAAPDGPYTAQAELPSAPEPPAPQRTIVLAEDNELNIMTVADYLETHGYRVAVARDGRAAIALAKTLRPQAILMDIYMPGMDGLEAIRQIRADADVAATPIIALTALAMPSDYEHCLAAGANGYLTKPVNLKELAAALDQQIRASV